MSFRAKLHRRMIDPQRTKQLSFQIIHCIFTNRPFHRYDFELVQFLCRLAALDLQKNDFYGTNVNLQHSVLLADLLNGNVTDGETATVRSTQLGWVLSSSMYIVTIFDQNFGVFDRKARLVSEALHPLLPNSRWVIYDNKIVYFVSYPTDIYAEDVLDSGLMEYLSKNRLTAAISGRFQTLLELRQAYQQSLAAFELGCRISPGQTIYWYRDCLPYHIGELLSRQAPLRSFCHPGVLRLAEYDQANQTQYLTTLASYLNHAETPLKAAEELFIHKNTLFYRIRQIKERLGLRLEEGSERMRIQLTLAFLRLL